MLNVVPFKIINNAEMNTNCFFFSIVHQVMDISVHMVIFSFSKQAFYESLDFVTVRIIMNDTNLIDRCKAHLHMQHAWISNSFARSDTDVVIDSEPHPRWTCKTSGGGNYLYEGHLESS